MFSYKSMLSFAILWLFSGFLYAGGLDRSNHPYSSIFDEGTTLNFSYLHVDPNRSGVAINEDTSLPPNFINGFLQSYDYQTIGFKKDITKRLSCLLQYDNGPYGFNSDYPTLIDGPGRTLLESEETSVLCSVAITQDPENEIKLLLGGSSRKITNGFFSQQTRGVEISAAGLDLPLFLQPILDAAVSPLTADLEVSLESDNDEAFNVGFSYEKKSTKTRLSFMYFGSTSHKIKGTLFNPLLASLNDNLGLDLNPLVDATASTITPASMQLDITTGLSKKWQIAGVAGINHTAWSDLNSLVIDHDSFLPAPVALTLFENDVTVYYVGLGKKFSDSISAGFRVVWEGESEPPVTRSGVDARATLGVGMKYSLNNLDISPLLTYSILDSHGPVFDDPFTYKFNKSSAFGFGLKLKYTF